MTRPAFNADLIAGLRAKVAAHNEGAPESAKVKLNDLKRIYERSFKGDQPAARALGKVDAHLAELAKAFDPSKHPRRPDGKFGSEKESPSALDAAAAHVKNAAGAASDAAGAAAAGVKRGLHHAAYIHGFADAPPLPEGVKIPKAPLNLPADKDQHRALQSVNAGYSAFTSDVIPERRFEALGELARTGVALTGGALITHILTSKNPNNRTRRALESAISYPPAKIAAVAYGAPLHVIGVGYELAHQKLGLAGDAVKVRRFAYNFSAKVERNTRRLARGAAHRTISAARFGVGKFIDTVEGLPSEFAAPAEPITARRFSTWAGARGAAAQISREITLRGIRPARRAGAIAAIALVPTAAISRAIQASSLDPQKAGETYDQLSYRVVNKVLGMPETHALAKALTSDLRKAAALEGLESGVERIFGRASGTAITGLTSLGSSGIGAAAGAGSQAVANALNGDKGNPYHDSHGRFTSKDGAEPSSGIGHAALVGAGIGAAIGGGAAHFRLRAFNQRVFREAMEHLDNHIRGLTEPAGAKAEASIIPAVKKLADEHARELENLKAEKTEFVDKSIAADSGVKAARAEIEQYGSSNPTHYKEKIRADINRYLASILTPHDNFMLPEKSGKSLIYMPEVRARVARFDEYARNAIDGATPEAFAGMIANLTPAQKTAALHIFAKRADISDMVDKALAGHVKKIDDAIETIKAKSQAIDDAEKAALDTKARVDMHPEDGPERTEALAAHEKAVTAIKSAERAGNAAQKKLDELRSMGPEVRSPIDERLIAPPSRLDNQTLQQSAELKARARAEAEHAQKVDKAKKRHATEIRKARDAYAADLKLRHARQVGAFVTLGRRAAGLGSITGRAVDPLISAHADHAAALGALEAAEAKLSAARGMVDRLTEEKEGLERGAGKAKREALSANLASRKAKVKVAEDEYAKAQQSAASKESALLAEADKFLNKYNKFRSDSQNSNETAHLPPSLIAEMTRDIGRAAQAGYDPISRYAVQPTADALRDAMAYVGPRARVVGAGFARAADRTFKGMFLRQATDEDPDSGQKTSYWVPDPFKIAFWSATGAGAATIDFLRHYGEYAHSQVLGDGKVKSPTNLQVELRRHPTKENEGLFAVHAADPRNKGERVIIFGHRYEEGRPDPINLNPGARLKDVTEHFQNRSGNQGGQTGKSSVASQDAGWLSEKAKSEINGFLSKMGSDKKAAITGPGVSIPARHSSDSDGNNAAGTFMNEFRARWVKPETASNSGAMYGALEALFQKQSEILKSSQFYQMLTGYKGNEKKGDGIFKPNEDFGSSDRDEVAGALDSEITRIMDKAAPRDDAQRDALRRAVAVIGKSRNLPPETLQPIYDKIGGAAAPQRETVYSESATLPHVPVEHRTAHVRPAVPDEISEPIRSPRDFDNPYSDQAAHVASNIAPRLGLRTDSQREMLTIMIEHYIKQVSKAQNLDIPVAGKIVSDAMIRSGGGDRVAQAEFARTMASTDHAAFEKAINQAIRRHKNEQAGENSYAKADFVVRGSDLDSLDVLMKRMPAIFNASPYDPGAPSPTPKAQPKYTGTDAVAAAADLAGAGVANHALNHIGALKTPEIGTKQVIQAIASPLQSLKTAGSSVAGAFEGGAGAGLKAVGRGTLMAGKLAAKGLIAGAAGAGLYNLVQGAGGGASYARNTSTGETLAMGAAKFGGATAGELAGEAAAGRFIGEGAGALLGTIGGPAGEVAGGAAGAALGDYLGHKVFKFFNGYHPATVQRVLQTKLTAPADQASEVQAGEIGGGIVGNAVAGAKGEGLASAVGAALGAAHARATADVSNVLHRRPKQPATGIA
jgi:actin-related protein